MTYRSLIRVALVLIVSGFILSPSARGMEALVDRAIDGDFEAVATLRSLGPDGLELLLHRYQTQLTQEQGIRGEYLRSDQWPALSSAIDEVAQQKDAHASGLYWYTDLEQAKSAARERNVPILSLRLLGTLDTDLSCANSRFIRTMLYPNQAISKALRERFVLHWESVRPVPVVTIDFGDGRVIERTVTGNSIHYILDHDGRPIDALPGLYGPVAFLRGLKQAEDHFHQLSAAAGPDRRRDVMLRYHTQRLADIIQTWSDDLERIESADSGSSRFPAPVFLDRRQAPPVDPLPFANQTVQLPEKRQLESEWRHLAERTDDDQWQRIARLYFNEMRLDDVSRRLIDAKQPPEPPRPAPSAEEAARLARAKVAVERPLVRMLRNLQNTTAEDTVRNEYLFRAQIHQWFASGDPATTDISALNEKVYAELFLTPSDDPWLGLAPADTFSALDGAGLRE